MIPPVRRNEDARAIFAAAVRAVQADHLLTAEVLKTLAPGRGAALRVIGFGKAAMAMAGVLEAELGAAIREGLVVVPHDYPSHLPDRLPAPERIAVETAGHPVPDERSVRAGRRFRAIAESCASEDTLVVLISGGGSALAVDVPDGVTLPHVQQTVRALLTSGAPIQAINAVRKHLSRFKGGQLARAAAPATVRALVVSDVVGDDLSTIASGPTVPDPSTYGEAIEALKQHDVWTRVPAAVRQHLKAGHRGAVAETPKPGTAVFDHVTTQLVGTNRHALDAAAEAARARGYEPHILDTEVTGEARAVARSHVQALRDEAGSGPVCGLWGGEPTVTVTGSGTGGRNQEAALAGAIALEDDERAVTLLCGGTDGIDGPTDAAGAWATPATVRAARRLGLDPRAHLDNNDAYPFFEALDQLLKLGPTHTNVMDVHIGLVSG
jgi:hydroxypyruvate reductase